MIRISCIKGYKTPTMNNRAVVAMFADDTTVFLSHNNNFHALNMILNYWCIASEAKFNIDKTEIIPIGSPEHCTRIIETRKLHPLHNPIPRNIQVAKNRMAVRILGAWLGNKVNQATVWSTIIDQIKNNFQNGNNHIHP
ncbi:hypothetical protein CONPUDRAFT_60230 [Coniophora puteana RWD-64-598 SS2]|uniref:Reverse transcriptase domain-containing protein n=1 Tax=Coniophora puteana (strain RWD-64-598) TaxID=741705 RepID=A0A5M3MK00_CONPW|nr:uncharacterized protein CONPUDRAFT_60230 [Coniophora puteana RWD-64-598 SS2]EIW79134.1 hypothetical protein CONPUDRAFT_60230 [Coniophora puteana RWD-64-598 SS2]